MKKFIISLICALSVIGTATAGANRAEGITIVDKGSINLGVGIGTPCAAGVMFPVDISFGVAGGFINTSKFGNNGGIDIGLQYVPEVLSGGGFTNALVVRPLFHFQFLKQLDAYAGFHGGVGFASGGAWGLFGMVYGARWQFTDLIGVKFELEPTFINWNATPFWSAGVNFHFR